MLQKNNHQDDLDLLLSLEDRVLETPPASPSDDGKRKKDMSVFLNFVDDCLDYDPKDSNATQKPKQQKISDNIMVDKFSKLRIMNPEYSPAELSNHLADIKFIHLPTIKSLDADSLEGIWATLGVLTEKGIQRTSSIGKPFAIWKLSCLSEETISLFLFGDAFQRSCEATVGTIYALFNCSARRNKTGHGYSLSVYSGKQILRLGTSADMGFCQGGGRDGQCRNVINKRVRKYCNEHKTDGFKKYNSTRTELRGGNLNTGYRDYLKCEGIYVVKPPQRTTNSMKNTKPVKVLSVEGLKKAISNSTNIQTQSHSQGIRFLNHVMDSMNPKVSSATVVAPKKTAGAQDKSQASIAKRQKTGNGVSVEAGSKRTIEVDIMSSDDEGL